MPSNKTKKTSEEGPKRPSSCSINSGCFFPGRCKAVDMCIYSLPRRQRAGHFTRDEEPSGPSESV